MQNQRDQYGLQVTQLQADKDKLLHNVGRLDEIVRRADPSSIPSASGDSSGTSAHVDWQAEHEKVRIAAVRLFFFFLQLDNKGTTGDAKRFTQAEGARQPA